MSIGPIAQVSMLSADIERAAKCYLNAFDWRIAAHREITAVQAESWNAPELAGAAAIQVVGRNGSVQFIQCDLYHKPAPLKTHGWTALEICVDDVNRYTEQALAAGFEMLNEPVPLAGSAKPLPLIAAQLAGPAGECIYITQILGEVPNFELPDVSTESGSIFICVLGASDLEASRAQLEQPYQLRRASDREVAVKVLNRVYQKPLTELHRISSLQLNGQNAIEIDQMPSAATARPKQPGYLPPGISIVTVIGDVTKPTVVQLPDDALLEIIPA
jgi:predicted enzyme related to lactoylglutathione lyase